MSLKPEALIPAAFICSRMRLKSSRLSECVGLSFTPLTSPSELTPTPLWGLFRHLFLNYGCFSFLKIKLLHYIVLLEVQNFKQFPNFLPILPLHFPSQYFDPKFSSSLSEDPLCSNCLFKSHVSLEISFKISSLSLYSLLISPLAAIYLTL